MLLPNGIFSVFITLGWLLDLFFIFSFIFSKGTKQDVPSGKHTSILQEAFLVERCRERDIPDEAMVRKARERRLLCENILLSLGAMLLLFLGFVNSQDKMFLT